MRFLPFMATDLPKMPYLYLFMALCPGPRAGGQRERAKAGNQQPSPADPLRRPQTRPSSLSLRVCLSCLSLRLAGCSWSSESSLFGRNLVSAAAGLIATACAARRQGPNAWLAAPPPANPCSAVLQEFLIFSVRRVAIDSDISRAVDPGLVQINVGGHSRRAASKTPRAAVKDAQSRSRQIGFCKFRTKSIVILHLPTLRRTELGSFRLDPRPRTRPLQTPGRPMPDVGCCQSRASRGRCGRVREARGKSKVLPRPPSPPISPEPGVSSRVPKRRHQGHAILP